MYLQQYFTVAALALAVHEYLITSKGEVELIWPSRFSLPKALFYTNRYLPIITAVFTTYMEVFDTTYDNCEAAVVISSLLLSSCYICAEVTLCVRIYALWGRRRTILIFLAFMITSSAIGGYYLSVSFALSGRAARVRLFHSGCLLLFSDQNEHGICEHDAATSRKESFEPHSLEYASSPLLRFEQPASLATSKSGPQANYLRSVCPGGDNALQIEFCNRLRRVIWCHRLQLSGPAATDWPSGMPENFQGGYGLL
ncbi:uncharacterized protein FOMMEDRAFT_151984 [Fomitiporia mediterranea MF3/22]|uniref:uncharacterized protein n=1 Tax=Fomitiporia mediterranea (strain MF3/22) TaxID=694068 RepID=UPI0004409875|nr:uncharacterized protein FOMMEDRAFT_151984 [Fomitiporia mediterranea MF3/22]EJD06685.1 hypothetical protein FOMMEDRAFT_151984 [Fomitiporia mediterranea MF3/22]